MSSRPPSPAVQAARERLRAAALQSRGPTLGATALVTLAAGALLGSKALRLAVLPIAGKAIATMLAAQLRPKR